MNKILLILSVCLLLGGCSSKIETSKCTCPEFPLPSNYVIDKLANQNDTEINNWIIRLWQHKKMIDVQNKK